MGLITWTIFLILLVLIFPKFSKYFRRYVEYRQKLNKLPKSECNFFIGHIWNTLVPRNQLLEAATKVITTSPPLCVLWFGPVPIIALSQPKHIEVILGSTEYINKPYYYLFLSPWLGKGLLTSTGSKWHSRRKMLTPAFHFAILENFVEVFAKRSQILVKKLQKEIGSKSFNMYSYITTCTLDIICETAMGIKINAQDQEEPSDYVEAVCKCTIDLMERALAPWLYPGTLFNISSTGRRFKKHVNILHSFSRKVIQERKHLFTSDETGGLSPEDLDLGKKKKMTFLDILLETSKNGENLTDEDIREEVDTFMFEGHDTITTAMSWALYLLANHPDVQEKAYEELELIFQDSDRTPTMKDLNEMKYLERVIKETLRLYPSVPILGRYHKNDIEIDGHVIPGKTTITILPYFTHRLPEYYPDPEKFNPDNFLPEKVAARHPYAYIPFSAGPRNCIGQKFAILEQKTVLSYIIRNYELHATNSTSKPIPELVLRPDIGVMIKITPRKGSLLNKKKN